MSDRYATNPSEDDLLPNKLGLADSESVNEEEAVGFLRAEHAAIDALGDDTAFSLEYLYQLHQDALGHLYEFAGRLRTVDMSKSGFMFAPMHVLPQTMQIFENEYLKLLNAEERNGNSLLEYLAEMHAELLYIHPFREGNGRIVRLFLSDILLLSNKRQGKNTV